MKQLYRLPLSATVLTIALAVSLPCAAGAKSDGHGKHGRGDSSESRGGHSGKREYSDGGGSRSSDKRAYADREGGRNRGEWRESGDRRGEWRGSGSRGSGSRDDVRYRDRGSDYRADRRWQDSGRRSYQPSGRYRTSYRDDRSYSDYRPRTYYRDGGRSYSNYRSRSYYVGSFHRPRFVYRSGFSLGFTIGMVPSYGYRYYDPYCDMEFNDLGAYYDHCDDYDHPDAILVLEIHSGYPIASCAYHDGYWVVDDCY
jgi:hypothetical protein